MVKYLLRYRRHSKEAYWTSKEFISLLKMSNFLENIFNDTEQPSLEMKLYKIDDKKYIRKDLGF